jgi:hypothetical protein
MEKYLKLFQNITLYENEPEKPKIGHCIDDLELIIYKKPNNVLTYYADRKLNTVYTTGSTAGLHINVFNTSISSHTFENGVGVITFINDLTTIGKYAFYGCSGMTKVELPDSVATIGVDAFGSCSALEEINIPKNLTEIDHYGFSQCTSLKKLDMKDSNVSSIGTYLVTGDNNLSEITINDKITSLSDSVFASCGVESIEILDSVTTFGENIFAYCSKLKYAKIPESMTTLPYGLFNRCGSLLRVNSEEDGVINVPPNVTYIGRFCFMNCKSFTTVNLPDTLEEVDQQSFYSATSLTHIVFPESMKKIGYESFAYCSSLVSVTCLSTTPPELAYKNIFYGNASGRKFYVPAESLQAYKTARYWSNYASDILPIP